MRKTTKLFIIVGILIVLIVSFYEAFLKHLDTLYIFKELGVQVKIPLSWELRPIPPYGVFFVVSRERIKGTVEDYFVIIVSESQLDIHNLPYNVGSRLPSSEHCILKTEEISIDGIPVNLNYRIAESHRGAYIKGQIIAQDIEITRNNKYYYIVLFNSTHTPKEDRKNDKLFKKVLSSFKFL
jgi:hypothetical protein